MSLVEVTDLTVGFGSLRAVDGLSFRLDQGAALALVGESGSGKSTVASALLGLHRGTGARVGGSVEVAAILQIGGRADGRAERTPLAAWVLRVQGNLSLVALALSILLVWQDLAWALPGLWLLLLGHSLYLLGGLAFPPMRTCGAVFQAGGVLALWPRLDPLWAFAAATAAGNLWMALQVWRLRREAPPSRPTSRSPSR